MREGEGNEIEKEVREKEGVRRKGKEGVRITHL